MIVTAHDGLPIAVSTGAGSGPGLLACHATGFCKECWDPVLADPALDGTAWAAVDQRAHGDTGAPPLPFDWWDNARDVLAVVDTLGWEHPVGLGHSSGAAALLMAEILRPGTFAALVAVEPIVFPGPVQRWEDIPLAAQAERRRAAFPSRDAALEWFRGRGAFAHWDDSVLRAYIEHGFRADDGGGVALKCRPEHEAEHYRCARASGAWDRLGEVGCPVLVAGGADSHSHPRAFLEEQAARLPDARVEILEGATHFAPMERPAEVAGWAARALAGVDPGPR